MAIKTTSFKYSLGGGQFQPDLPGQFAPIWGGQLQPDLPGHIERIFHLTVFPSISLFNRLILQKFYRVSYLER
jgi:hypothetical protein